MANHIISMSNYPGASTAALRTWGAAINNGLTQVLGAGNLVASTIDWNTITLPSFNSSVFGYEVWKLDDPSHISSPPVYIKFNYRTTASVGGIFIIVNVGTGWDGSALTGPGASTSYQLGTTYSDSSVCQSWMSSDGDGFVWFNNVDTNNVGNAKFVFVVDRQRNSNGLAQANTGWPPSIGYLVGSYYATAGNPSSFISSGVALVCVDPISGDVVNFAKWPIITRANNQTTALSGDGTKTLVSPMWNVNRQGSYISKMVVSIPRNDVNAGSVVNIDFLNATRQYKGSSQYSSNFGYVSSVGSSVALWWDDV